MAWRARSATRRQLRRETAPDAPSPAAADDAAAAEHMARLVADRRAETTQETTGGVDLGAFPARNAWRLDWPEGRSRGRILDSDGTPILSVLAAPYGQSNGELAAAAPELLAEVRALRARVAELELAAREVAAELDWVSRLDDPDLKAWRVKEAYNTIRAALAAK